jgi:predicted metal-dependent HD superfamily phosphohydrolase
MTPDLLAAYAEPHRRYHGLAHVEDCLARLAEVEGLSAEDRRLVELAIWWHDAVYDPTRSDNEEVSAERAEAALLAAGEAPETAAEVARLVRLTKGHAVEPGDRRGALLVSIDLSILGREPEAYDAYVEGVRAEYAFVPDELWRAGRATVLRRFLEAETLYPDPAFRARFEARARENTARELESLRP